MVSVAFSSGWRGIALDQAAGGGPVPQIHDGGGLGGGIDLRRGGVPGGLDVPPFGTAGHCEQNGENHVPPGRARLGRHGALHVLRLGEALPPLKVVRKPAAAQTN